MQHASEMTEQAGQGESQRLSMPLSPMERKVFKLIQTGITEREVADRLQRSPNTIHVHVRNIYRKHLVHSRSELIHKTLGDNNNSHGSAESACTPAQHEE